MNFQSIYSTNFINNLTFLPFLLKIISENEVECYLKHTNGWFICLLNPVRLVLPSVHCNSFIIFGATCSWALNPLSNDSWDYFLKPCLKLGKSASHLYISWPKWKKRVITVWKHLIPPFFRRIFLNIFLGLLKSYPLVIMEERVYEND